METTQEAQPMSFEHKVSLTTSIVAVALAISSILSNAVGDDLILSRSAANNEWSYFQSKSIKQNMFEVNYEMLELELTNEGLSPGYKERMQKTADHFKAEVERYDKEKNEIKSNAKRHEEICEKADQKGNVLDLAEALYQISIILSAVSMIAHSRLLWIMSMILGTCAMLTTGYAYFFMP